jgi:hypothetical protein
VGLLAVIAIIVVVRIRSTGANRYDVGWLLALPLVVGLLGWIGVADWREYNAEADRLAATVRSDPGHVVRHESRVHVVRHTILDGGRKLRLYFHAPRHECVLSRVEVLHTAGEVQISVYGGAATSDETMTCPFSSAARVPNRHVDARLGTPVGKRRVHGAGTAAPRHYWPWADP